MVKITLEKLLLGFLTYILSYILMTYLLVNKIITIEAASTVGVPNWFVAFVICNFPGLALAVIILFGNRSRKYIIAGTAVFLSALLLWGNLIVVGTSPIPESAFEKAAAMYNIKNCGVYRTSPGLNIIKYNVTVTGGTQCYVLILRPEPRNQYIFQIRDGWGKVKVIEELSDTNVFTIDYDLMPAGSVFLWLLDTGRIKTHIPYAVMDERFRTGRYDFLGYGTRYRDDYVFYFNATQIPATLRVTTDNSTTVEEIPVYNPNVTLNVQFYLEIEAIRSGFP